MFSYIVIFDIYDSNKDSFISREELVVFLSSVYGKIFKNLNKNISDGNNSIEESGSRLNNRNSILYNVYSCKKSYSTDLVRFTETKISDPGYDINGCFLYIYLLCY